MDFIATLENELGKKKLGNFRTGDTVKVHYRIREGDKERIQIFEGTVIAIKNRGIRENFIVRRIVQGEGVERTFPVHSPNIAKIEITRHGDVRRSKLYYLRSRLGKATKVRELLEGREGVIMPGTETVLEAQAAKAADLATIEAAAVAAAAEKAAAAKAAAASEEKTENKTEKK